MTFQLWVTYSFMIIFITVSC